MTIAGIDFSSKAVDVVLLDEDTDRAVWHRFELAGQDAFDRARAVRAAMPPASFWDDVLACGIEDPRGYGAGSLYRVQGAILSSLPARMLVQPLIPSSWRKTVGLSGAAPKATVATHARALLYRASGDRYETEDWPQDALDAYLVARATRMLIERGQAAA